MGIIPTSRFLCKQEAAFVLLPQHFYCHHQLGRSGLTLILKGSRSKKAPEWEWGQLPDYALRHLTAAQVTRKVDWCIHHKRIHSKRPEESGLLRCDSVSIYLPDAHDNRL